MGLSWAELVKWQIMAQGGEICFVVFICRSCGQSKFYLDTSWFKLYIIDVINITQTNA